MLETPSKTQTESLVEALRLDIVKGSLKPGDRLGMAALQTRYDVGLSPLREALSRLTSLGLVTSEGQRGFRVARVSPADLLDLMKTMVWVEATALNSAILQGDRDWEAELLAAAHRLGITGNDKTDARFFEDDWEDRHGKFHLALVAACRAPRLLEYRALLWDNVKRYRLLSAFYERGTRDIDGEHRGLVEAVLSRDAPKAVQLMQRHLVTTCRVLLTSDPDTADQTDDFISTLEGEIARGRGISL